MGTVLREVTRLTKETVWSGGSGGSRRPIQIITPGWGSSGYYSAGVLERAAQNRVIPAGTHMYLNHASSSERKDRPERDVEKLAGVLAEDARWDGTRLVAEADLLGANGELVETLAPYIGVSIDGSATDIVIGEAEGRTGPIIQDLAVITSVDFVTHAGRGGRVLLESARPTLVNSAAASRGVAEATVNDTRELLTAALRDAYNGDDVYVWVKDFDQARVWFELEAGSAVGTFEQTYTLTGDVVTLTGGRVEVRAVTTYAPVTHTPTPSIESVPDHPAGQQENTEEPEESRMGTITIDEAQHATLTEQAGRVEPLIAERDAAITRAEHAEAELAARVLAESARQIIDKAGVAFTALERRGLLADLPVTEDGELDTVAFTETVTQAATDRGTVEGAGRVTGYGGGTVTETRRRVNAFGRKLED